MKTEAKFEVPTWNQIYKMLLSQAKKIRSSGFNPGVIIGILRGGWFSARVLSDLLEIPNLSNVSVEYYLGVAETKKEPVLTQNILVDVIDKKVLIVDDVADTGNSLKLVKEHILQLSAKEVKIATVYYKPWSVIKPDYYEKETSLWIVFPWEIKETIRKIVGKSAGKSISIKEETAKLAKAGLPKQLVERFLKEICEEKIAEIY